tara:strand:+ start:5511 stop:5708 length:198 start_codon:yes stop_codon:yes gene_type:complete
MKAPYFKGTFRHFKQYKKSTVLLDKSVLEVDQLAAAEHKLEFLKSKYKSSTDKFGKNSMPITLIC